MLNDRHVVTLAALVHRIAEQKLDRREKNSTSGLEEEVKRQIPGVSVEVQGAHNADESYYVFITLNFADTDTAKAAEDDFKKTLIAAYRRRPIYCPKAPTVTRSADSFEVLYKFER